MKGKSCSTSSWGAPWVRVPPYLAFPLCPQDVPSHSLQPHPSHWPQLSVGPPCPRHQPLLWAGSPLAHRCSIPWGTQGSSLGLSLWLGQEASQNLFPLLRRLFCPNWLKCDQERGKLEDLALAPLQQPAGNTEPG